MLTVFLTLAALAGPQPIPNAVPGRVQLLEERLAPEKRVAAVRGNLVTFQPGQAGGPHKHPVPVFGYVTRGTIAFQVEGESVKILTAGQAFHEAADAVVVRFDNASRDEEAAFVAFYLMGSGDTETLQTLPAGVTK